MTTIRFIVSGLPGSKGRARSFRLPNGGIGHYTPRPTERYESLVRDAYFAMIDQETGYCWSGPVGLTVKIFFQIPASWPKWRREWAEWEPERATKRPDWDNAGKIVADALNAIAYEDDAQICHAVLEKYYATNPRVEVELTKLMKRRKEDAP